MPVEKLNSQNYSNIGGINEKSSQYQVNLTQFLNIQNMDFNVPGALITRPGSTNLLVPGANATGPISSLFEYQKLSGESYILAGTNTGLYNKVGNSLALLDPGWSNGQPIDFQTFINKAWMANGAQFKSWDGTTLRPFGLPCAPGPNLFGGTGFAAMTLSTTTFWGISMYAFENAQVYIKIAYLRDDGLIGGGNFIDARPQFPQVDLGDGKEVVSKRIGFTLSGITTPSGYGITAIAVFAYLSLSGPLAQPNIVGAASFYTFSEDFNSRFKLVGYYAPGTTVLSFTRTSINNWSSGNFPQSVGFSGSNFCFLETYTPKYIELANNRFFYSGFSNAPSTSFYSELAQPEKVFPASNFEARTNDGDRLTGQKFYNNQMLLFKQNSFHKVVGTSPENFELIEVTAEFGALSNKAIVEYKDKLMFLDAQGIVEYNGVDWEVISTPIEDTMRRMNISAAMEKAVGVHYKDRNQVWFGIPLDDSTENNITIVFDYLIEAWTFFTGFNPSSLAPIKNSFNRETVWMGNYSGMIKGYGASFVGDGGTSILSSFITRFESPDGANVTNMWRRIFLDVAQYAGASTPIDVKVYADYDLSTVRATFSILQNQFQTRRDFGVMAKSMAFEVTFRSASYPLLLNGYVTSRRFLRNV